MLSTGDNAIDLGELYDLIKEVADKYDYKLPRGWKKHVKKIFDYVDANHDGHVTKAEIEAAMAKHEDVELEEEGP